MAINRIKSGAVIIAGSGMCTGGRIVHHFKHNLWRPECHVVFPGFQARGTLGRNIVDGASAVRVFHQRIAVKAQIHTLGGFSAHAGQSQLLDWVGHFAHRPALYLIHGERERWKRCRARSASVSTGMPRYRNPANASRSEPPSATVTQSVAVCG